MRVLTWCNQIDERSELLFASARHFNIDVEPIGLGKEYRGGVSKIEWLRDWLQENCSGRFDDTIICVTDAFDCVWLRSPSDMVQSWIGADVQPIVYAGEKWYRKRPPDFQEHFDERGDSIYRYPNCGCVFSPTSTLSMLLDTVVVDANSTEQWHMTKAIAESDFTSIDERCDLFWCCAGQWRQVPKLARIENGRLTNIKTGGQPYVLHSPIPNRSQELLRDIARKVGVPV